jgi:hypothetical protein
MKTLRAIAAALLIASATLAAPALAQSAGFDFVRSGPGTGASPGGTHGGGWNGERPRDRERWRKRCLRNGRCGDWGSYGFGYGYGGGIGHQDMMAGGRYGYFSQGGDARGLSNGRPTYDYDRGYPYEYYREGARADRSEGPGNRYARARARECSVDTTRDRRTGREVEIRVCRN